MCFFFFLFKKIYQRLFAGFLKTKMREESCISWQNFCFCFKSFDHCVFQKHNWRVFVSFYFFVVYVYVYVIFFLVAVCVVVFFLFISFFLVRLCFYSLFCFWYCFTEDTGAIILIWFILIYTYSWRYAGYWYCGPVYIHVIDWFVEEVWKARKGRLQWTWRWRWAPSLPLYLTMSFSIWSMENCSAFTSKFEVLCITAHNLDVGLHIRILHLPSFPSCYVRIFHFKFDIFCWS